MKVWSQLGLLSEKEEGWERKGGERKGRERRGEMNNILKLWESGRGCFTHCPNLYHWVWLVPLSLNTLPSTLSSHSCKACPFLSCLFPHSLSHRSTTGPPSRSGICQADFEGGVKIGEVRVRKSRWYVILNFKDISKGLSFPPRGSLEIVIGTGS